MPNEKLREIIIQWHNTYPTPVNILEDLVSRIESAFELKERKKTEEPINQTTTLTQLPVPPFTADPMKIKIEGTIRPQFINCPCGRVYEIRKDSFVCLY